MALRVFSNNQNQQLALLVDKLGHLVEKIRPLEDAHPLWVVEEETLKALVERARELKYLSEKLLSSAHYLRAEPLAQKEVADRGSS